MSNEWIGIVKELAPKYLDGVADDLTTRDRLMLAMMEQRGQIETNCSSFEERYDVDYKEAPVEAYGDGGIVDYSRRDYLKQATMDWRGYTATDLMTIKEMEMMKGDVVIVDRYRRIFPKLTQSCRNQFGLEMYIDGGSAANANRFCGLETFCGADTSYDSVGADVADLVAVPSDTYNTISTELNQAGRWSAVGTAPNANVATDWPEGEGSSEYDYWSPKLVNYTSTSYGGTGAQNTWLINAELCMRRTAQWLALTTGAGRATLMTILSGELFTGFKAVMAERLRFIAEHPEARDLGFPQVLNFEGVGIYTEFGIPAATGYMLNVDKMRLKLLGEKLIQSKGPDYDPDTLSYKFAVYSFGNFQWTPKYHAKLYPYAAS